MDLERCEAEHDWSNTEVLHVRITDPDTGKIAHVHFSVGIKNGRPYGEVVTIRENDESRKSATATWRQPS
jgi:hypothetical protein